MSASGIPAVPDTSGIPAVPDAPVPQGQYTSARIAGGLVFTAGMTPRAGGTMAASGVLGAGLTVPDARPLAELAARRAVEAGRQAAEAAGLRLESAVSMTVWVAATAEFSDHSRVADGASTAVLEELGDPAPARAAIGVSGLPSGAPVEVALVLTTATATATATATVDQ
ncbi:RidA family protein [Streptomyces sp. BH-SS-21]|uniref:RidA family protein n=1 Tax=Streptomyces liliiviolaceus TaxID=2823109 RepID=A0A941BI67_9ACTN|nr:RidA family protein [Streptomyces liliiviolaceus]MBQ0854579.1 RidA family protein [Streptomyces liliiviolaceus]